MPISAFQKYSNPRIWLRRAALAATVCSALFAPLVAHAASNHLTLKLGPVTVYGNLAKQSCSGQVNLTSERGAPVGASLYYVEGKSLYLLVTHPDLVKGKQKVKFAFPDGKKVTFPMKRHGKLLQITVGIGPRGLNFYNAVMSNARVTVDLSGINDTVKVDLRDKVKFEAAARYCRTWLYQ
jgi:hypothetical protein